jgi:hypothetical protein
MAGKPEEQACPLIAASVFRTIEKAGFFGVIFMQAIKATVQDGSVIFNDPLPPEGCYEAVLVLLDPNPWDAILNDPRPRPELEKASQAAMEEFLSGKTTPLNPETMP